MMVISRATLLFLVLTLGSPPLDAKAPAPGELRAAGSVDFPISCRKSVQPDFVRGVALLHSFFYEEARRLFESVAERDPACAMAHWGVAMSWWHPIWTPPTAEEMAAGAAAAERASQMKASPKERAFIDAVNAYYATHESTASAAGPVGQSCHGPVGPRDRVMAYERAMHRANEAFPDDFEIQVFYAFAVLSVGYATPTDTSLANQKRASEMLQPLWKQNRKHPGVTHYLIHAYDYPHLAAQGLEPARAYAEIAPWVPHALHMPSHIFTRLGMWPDAVASNQAAAEASRAYARQRGRDAVEVETLHALDYQMYSYLQEARDGAAKKVLEEIVGVKETFPPLEFVGAYALSAVPARYALERHAWTEAASLPVPQRPQWQKFPFIEATFEYAHALGRVHTGDVDGARNAVERMKALHAATKEAKFDYFKKHVELQIQAASAWIAQAEGRGDEAIAALRAAADAEDALGKHPVTPGALVPAREQLGDLLLALDKPGQALEAYEAALKIYPLRFRGLHGAGLAAEKAGKTELARDYYGKLLQQAKGADTQRAELAHARQFVGATMAAR
jgi:tetratricopeptide (TPR) repeat protein